MWQDVCCSSACNSKNKLWLCTAIDYSALGETQEPDLCQHG